jgi:G2/mitotic-specific cyclin 3/4
MDAKVRRITFPFFFFFFFFYYYFYYFYFFFFFFFFYYLFSSSPSSLSIPITIINPGPLFILHDAINGLGALQFHNMLYARFQKLVTNHHNTSPCTFTYTCSQSPAITCTHKPLPLTNNKQPQRPQRSLRIHDENALPSHPLPSKGTHQRNKSSTTLPTLMQNGAVRVAAKRAVFADVSNTTRAALVIDDGVKAHDNPKAAAGIHLQEPVVLSKLAQKPLAVKSITTSTTAPAASLPTFRKVQAKKSATILRDPEVAPAVTASVHESVKNKISQVELQNILDSLTSGAVQPAAHPEDVKLDIHALDQSAPGLEEVKVAVPSPSLTAANDEEYDEEDEDDMSESGITLAREGVTDNTTGGATVVLCPKYSAKVLKEIDEARLFVESNRTAEDIEDDQWDTSMVAEYGDEIFEYMRTLEVSRVHVV